jgi:hypothetical protein
VEGLHADAEVIVQGQVHEANPNYC